MNIPLISQIQHFSLQDGPGIRTTIFVKGCPLRCPWCHNPETQKTTEEFYYNSSRCDACGRCAAICPTGASELIIATDGVATLNFDREQCSNCMSCTTVCLTEARSPIGHRMTMEQIIKEAIADKPFFKNSGGGVSLSGGEPLLFPEFTTELVKRLKQEQVHVAIETTCCFKEQSVLKELAGLVDLFIVDLKSLNHQKHKEVTGGSLQTILDNLEFLYRENVNLRIHIPLVPQFNDTEEDLSSYIRYASKYHSHIQAIDILNYHSYGSKKYEFLGRTEHIQYQNLEGSQNKKTKLLINGFKNAGIKDVTVGGMVGIVSRRDETQDRINFEPIK